MEKNGDALLQHLAKMKDPSFLEIRRLRQAAFAAELLQEAGNVGYDEAGNLVKTLGGGKVEIIQAVNKAGEV